MTKYLLTLAWLVAFSTLIFAAFSYTMPPSERIGILLVGLVGSVLLVNNKAKPWDL